MLTCLKEMKESALISKGVSLISDNSLVLNGKSVPILSGEVQFFRMDPQVWEPSLEHVKKLGLPIVSTYLSWRRFSKDPDQVDLSGESDPRLNVPRFLDMCKKAQLYVTVKPGPWICGEEINGGYPDWLIDQPALQVMDAQDQPVKGYQYPFQSPIPSYFHPDYQFHVRRWLEAVDKVIKPYCYPDGPIILLQLDNEPSFAFHDRMFESDYNPVIARRGGLYSSWLKEKYVSITTLNDCYESAFTEFAEITPPRKLELMKGKTMVRLMDWVEFKEDILASHVASIRNYHLQNGIDEVLFTINYNLHPQLATPNNWHSLECASGMGGYDYYPNLPMDVENFIEVVQAINYSREVNRVAWSPEIMCGIWSFEGNEHAIDRLESCEYEYLYLTCLAYGLKGMNFYMLADRDNWVNSPINSRGELTETCEAVKTTVRLMNTIPSFDSLHVEQNIGVLYYRPYAREAFIAHENPGKLEGNLLGEAYQHFKQTYARLIEANINAGIYDPEIHSEKLPWFSILFAPGNRYMDAKTQQKLLDYIEQGGNLVCLPGIPCRDWDGAAVKILHDAFVNHDMHDFNGWKSAQIGKGRLIEVTNMHFDGVFLTRLLKTLSLSLAVTSSDPRVKTTLLKGQNEWVYFMVNTTEETMKVEISFYGIIQDSLIDGLSPDCRLAINDGIALLEIDPHSVKVFWRNMQAGL